MKGASPDFKGGLVEIPTWAMSFGHFHVILLGRAMKETDRTKDTDILHCIIKR
jgi:hypothetical protein